MLHQAASCGNAWEYDHITGLFVDEKLPTGAVKESGEIVAVALDAAGRVFDRIWRMPCGKFYSNTIWGDNCASIGKFSVRAYRETK